MTMVAMREVMVQQVQELVAEEVEVGLSTIRQACCELDWDSGDQVHDMVRAAKLQSDCESVVDAEVVQELVQVVVQELARVQCQVVVLHRQLVEVEAEH